MFLPAGYGMLISTDKYIKKGSRKQIPACGNMGYNKGCIFDLDGVLIDSMPMLNQVDKKLFEKLGIEYDEKAAEAVRYIPISETAAFLCSNYKLDCSRDELLKLLADTVTEGYRTVTLKEGVKEFLDKCRSRGFGMVIATATPEEIARPVAERLGLMDYMEGLVACTTEETTKKNVFSKAVSILELDRYNITVFEDGLPGAQCAKECDLSVVGVYDNSTSDEDQRKMRALCDRYVMSVSEI